jgi:hypothetical protein
LVSPLKGVELDDGLEADELLGMSERSREKPRTPDARRWSSLAPSVVSSTLVTRDEEARMAGDIRKRRSQRQKSREAGGQPAAERAESRDSGGYETAAEEVGSDVAELPGKRASRLLRDKTRDLADGGDKESVLSDIEALKSEMEKMPATTSKEQGEKLALVLI